MKARTRGQNGNGTRSGFVIWLLLLLLISLVACEAAPSVTPTPIPTSAPTDAATPVPTEPGREVKDLQGREIRLFIYGFDRAWMENDFNGKRTLNRFSEIETKFNCKLTILSGPKDTTNEAIWATIISGNPSADIIDGAGPHLIAQPVSNALYMDLNTFGVFDWSDEKWDPNIMELLEFKGKQYGCTTRGDLTQRYMLNNVMFFNRGLVQSAGYNPDDLYTWQAEGTWTWEKFEEVAEKISKLSTAETEIFGSISNDLRLYSGLVASMGAKWITNNADGIPEFTADDPKAMEALDFYLNLFRKGIIPDTDEYNNQRLFTSGTIGFMPDYLDKVNNKTLKISTIKDGYGLLMFPKHKDAEDYVSFRDWFGFWAIPTGASEPRDIALVINYLTDPMEGAADPQVIFESYVKDEGSLAVFDLIQDRTVILPTFMSNPVCRLWQGQLGLIRRGEKTPAEAIAENKAQYEAELDAIWKIG